MKSDLMQILCCPVCRGELTLSSRRTEGVEILEGSLTCPKCHVDYPIEDGIPDLLPPEDRE
ncbi:MAG: methytransferase partner Trm112 [Acidimicrobiales bacterium]|nr:methytransferase partner Trm112 [Acidimicrobiales bacterium]